LAKVISKSIASQSPFASRARSIANHFFYTKELLAPMGRRLRVKTVFTRIIGVILSFTGIIGIIFSIVALIALWTYKPDVSYFAKENIRLVGETLDTTQAGLVLAAASLESSIISITTLEATVEATARSIDDTAPLVETFVVLAREDLPNAVNSAQLSLVAAQDSAEIIDGVLSALAAIPFVPNDLYNPPVPLHVALGQVSESLENLPEALKTMEDSLNLTGQNLEVIQSDINLIAEDIHEINLSMAEAQTVMSDYQTLVSDFQVRVDRMDQNIERWIDTLYIILTFLFVLLGVSQLGLLTQGITLLA
jgi:methyl-accepting chemotaxis protein